MNFQPTDYLSNVNLDFGSNFSPVEEPISSTDLDLFTQSDFFDLDVFSNRFCAPNKSQQAKVKIEDEAGRLDMVSPVMVSPPVAEPSQATEENAASAKPGDLNEIKRRRNTAASARFRIKKKLKEKQMEEQTRQLQDKLSTLEKKLKTLEMENKCLKKLILEKNEKKNCDLLESIKKRSLGESGQDESSGFTFTN